LIAQECDRIVVIESSIQARAVASQADFYMKDRTVGYDAGENDNGVDQTSISASAEKSDPHAMRVLPVFR
jgi:hypothetical protein